MLYNIIMKKRILSVILLTLLLIFAPLSAANAETEFVRGEYINTGNAGIKAYTSMSEEEAVSFRLFSASELEIVSVLSGTKYVAVEIPLEGETLELYVLKADVPSTSAESTNIYGKKVTVNKANCLYLNCTGELEKSTLAVDENSELQIIGKVIGSEMEEGISDWYVVYKNGSYYYLYIQDTSDAVTAPPVSDDNNSGQNNSSSVNKENNKQLMNVLLSMAIAIPTVIIIYFVFRPGKQQKHYIPADIDDTVYEDRDSRDDDYIER